MPLAAIYARVSTAEQAESGFSLPTQLDQCQRYAASCGYEVPAEYVFSEDITGASLRRPQLQAVLTLVRERRIAALVVYDLDRLSRKLAHQVLISEELERAGVTLYVVTMPNLDRSPEGRLLQNVRSTIAEFEKEKILERTRRGLYGRAKAGKPAGRLPLGYRSVNGTVHIDPEEAALVRRIYDLLVNGQRSLNAIAKVLTAECIPTYNDRREPTRVRTNRAATWYTKTVYDV
jgi:site-specific DNA recombinase